MFAYAVSLGGITMVSVPHIVENFIAHNIVKYFAKSNTGQTFKALMQYIHMAISDMCITLERSRRGGTDEMMRVGEQSNSTRRQDDGVQGGNNHTLSTCTNQEPETKCGG